MIADNRGNRWLTHPGKKGVTDPGSIAEIEAYRDHAKQVMCGTALPAVRYKGQVIPARAL